MSKCAGCFSKLKRFEKTQTCPECKRTFCLLCIPEKKVVQDSRGQKITEGRDTCVYCTREHKECLKKEELDAAGNFYNRYYHNPHSSTNKTTVTKRTATVAQPEASADSEEIRRIEERLQRLKEPVGAHVSGVPSEAALKNRLDNLSEAPKPKGDAARASGQQPLAPAGPTEPTAGKSEAQEAQNLLEKVSDEVDLDRKLAGTVAGSNGATTTSEKPSSIGEDVQKLLDDMDVDLPDEDPEQLLEDLKGNLKRLASQSLHAVPGVSPANVKAKDNPGTTSGTEGTAGSTCAGSGGVKEAKGTCAAPEGEGACGKGGPGDPSLDGECTVREKPSLERGSSLQFHWEHFGTDPLDPRHEGVERSHPGDDGAMDDEVQLLIAQVLDEAELESKLDSTGHGDIVKEWDSRPADHGRKPQGGASVAVGPPPSGGASAASCSYSDFGKEDLPWCCICNDDATLRCFDCDGDLYCRRCYVEGHEQFGLYGHHVEAFRPPERQ